MSLCEAGNGKAQKGKAEKARFRILFADYKQLMSPAWQRTTL